MKLRLCNNIPVGDWIRDRRVNIDAQRLFELWESPLSEIDLYFRHLQMFARKNEADIM